VFVSIWGRDYGLTWSSVNKDSNTRLSNSIPSHLWFAQLINTNGLDRSQARDDWIRIEHDDDQKNKYWVRQNNGDGTFADHVQFDIGFNCDLGPHYAWADFNNDGLADFWCIGADSQVSVSVNLGTNPPTFQPLGQVVPTHAGISGDQVRIADIDGDGRADYCVILSNGGVGCSRNGGQGNNYYWQGFDNANSLRAQVIPPQSYVKTYTGLVFGDLNGDFRSDWMYIGDQGQVNSIINMRGWGAGIKPDWNDVGMTHAGMHVPGIQGNIKFGRIYGSGRLDYLYLKNETGWYDVYAFENQGTGGTRRKGKFSFGGNLIFPSYLRVT
jgi:hypothetical protein